MQRLDNSALRNGEISGQVLRPAAISAVCPHCKEKVTFSIGSYSQPGPQNSISGLGVCPSCRGKAGFWTLNPYGKKLPEAVEIYMSPPADIYYHDPGQLDNVPPPLKLALISTIDCYNAGIYAAAAVSGRRTLEGIFKYLVAEEKRNQPLAKLIDIVKAETDLSAPLSDLSHAIRSGGNLGAHFDMEHEPDEKVARQMLELLSYLISYLYVLPAKIKQLENDLGKVEAKDPV